ncbi:MAG: hypothetical protein EXS31_05330 [Pedosphaera sp.]|nr:hypothetical protein [Pedosphaera sp.]
MNRSILIVICDFLLVSLVAFSNFDDDSINRSGEKIDTTTSTSSTAKETGAREMMSVLTTALDEERQNRQVLTSDLDRSRATAEERQTLLNEHKQAIQQVEENLQRAEADARRVEEERAGLVRQMESSKRNIEALHASLADTRSEASLSREQVQALQTDLKKKQSESDSLRKQVADLENSRSNVLAVKQQLDTKLQAAEVETRVTKEHLNTLRVEKAQLQATTEKLATGVTALAETSAALTQEIRENRPLAANAIFAEFTRNRIDTHFGSLRAGAVTQEVKREVKSQTLLVSDGTNTCYAINHILDTPLTLWPPGTDWHALTGTISRGFFSYQVARVAFLAEDPRVMVIPVEAAQVEKLGAKVYKIAPDPFRFQEAVLVGANDSYYGECKFQIDVATPQYVKMDRSIFRGIFGKFNPSRGDLVLSKTGELLGIMTSNDYCAVLGTITPAFFLQCGDTLKAQRAGEKLTQLQNRVMQLPLKLQ